MINFKQIADMTRSLTIIIINFLCLAALVAILSGLSGWGLSAVIPIDK